MSGDNLFGLLDPGAEAALDEFRRSCEADGLPTPSQQEVLSDLVESMWRTVRRRATRLVDEPRAELPESIDPGFAARVVDTPPNPMSANCAAGDWTLIDALPESAYPRLEVVYAYHYDAEGLMLAPTDLMSKACRHFLQEFEATRERRRARHAIKTCPAGAAVLSALGLGGDADSFAAFIECHTFASGQAPDPDDELGWVVKVRNLETTRERYRKRVRYTAAAFQLYAEMASGLASRELPESAHVEFTDENRPDGYLLPFYVPQRNGRDWVHGYEGSLRPLTAYLEWLLPEQYANASSAYDDVASGRGHLVFVADTGRLPIGSTTADSGQHDAPPWLVQALEQVRDHPFDDGHGGTQGPFEQGRDWNPFADPH